MQSTTSSLEQTPAATKFVIVTVCYQYCDYLRACLPFNADCADEVVVVTDESDTETIEYIKQFKNVHCYISSRKSVYDIKFNKSALVNDGLRMALALKADWIALVDADTKIHSDFRPVLSTLNADTIYGCYRKIFYSKTDYEKGVFIPGEEVGPGYFQLFNVTAPCFANRTEWYDERQGLRGPDRYFWNKWKKNAEMPETSTGKFMAEHYGWYRVNWHGRTSPKWTDT